MFSSSQKSKCTLLSASSKCISSHQSTFTKRFYAPVGKHTKSYGFGVRNVVFPDQSALMTARLYRNKRGPRPEFIQYTNGLSNVMNEIPEEVDQLMQFDENGNMAQARADPRLETSDANWVRNWRSEYLKCVRLTDLDVDVFGMERVELDGLSFKHTLSKQLVVDYPVIHNVNGGKDRVLRDDWVPEKVIPGFEHLIKEDPRSQWTRNSRSKNKTFTVAPLEGYKNTSSYTPVVKTKASSLKNGITVFSEPENTEIYRNTLFSNSALAGNYIPPRVLGHNEPKVFFRPEEGKAYTLVMFTPDYPFRLTSDPHNMIHWMKVNVTTPKNGKEILSYLPPIPTECAGAFRYAFALFEQSKPIVNVEGLDYLMNNRTPKDLVKERFEDDLKQMQLGSEYIPEKPESPASLFDRRSVSMDELQQVLGWKTIWPSALSLDYDHTVTEVCRKHNIAEMFYVPPDYEKIHERREESRRQKHLASFDWN
eukprot:CAMPEP_0117452652 /NCGR_PEP_ID=MMETSP0759-20121206/9742_1 /TAXON_ID=63605 /ORGANISM="Percolomonas cosmopolitus, Strain WS" /LENGTH=479 /DNA_ID=CAMNT_0005245507 /DNA_START=160 /DNA_END=1599 /DNA_ORIENTATION=+